MENLLELKPANATDAALAINADEAPPQARTAVVLSKSTGKAIGTDYWFGPLSAKQLKEKLSKVYKGKELQNKVREGLRSERAQRILLGVAFVHLMAEKGILPDTAREGKNGATQKFVNCEAQQVDKAVADKLLADNEEMKRQMDAMRAELADSKALLALAMEETTIAE